MKPLHGITDGLAANLMSFFEVDYPRTEYVFGIASYEDPAVEVAAMLKPHYRFAPVGIVGGRRARLRESEGGEIDPNGGQSRAGRRICDQ